MDFDFATRIARSKGLVLNYDKEEKIFVLTTRGGDCLMTYAPVTIKLLTEARWRVELNTMRASR